MALPAEAARLDGGWQEVYSALQWIQFTMAMLSVIGSSSIIAYAVFQNAVRSPEEQDKYHTTRWVATIYFKDNIEANLTKSSVP